MTLRKCIDLEVAGYLSTRPRCVADDASPLEWWHLISPRFPKLSVIARRDLSSPPSSVESERLFSVATQIYSEERNWLKPENVDKLVFMNLNLRLSNVKYLPEHFDDE